MLHDFRKAVTDLEGEIFKRCFFIRSYLLEIIDDVIVRAHLCDHVGKDLVQAVIVTVDGAL